MSRGGITSQCGRKPYLGFVTVEGSLSNFSLELGQNGSLVNASRMQENLQETYQ